ncbi:NACHT, LRR and PYD domains-containing protein 3-like [Pangshura tecta]
MTHTPTKPTFPWFSIVHSLLPSSPKTLHITQRRLNGCFLSITSCWHLAAVLKTNQSLTELDLGYNQYIGDSRVQLLCEGLKHPNCKLQRLGLWNCVLKGASCGDLAAVLRTSQSLMELELRDNVSLGDSGVQLLCEGLKHPNCKLQRLGTSQHLTELELENKKLGDSRVKLLWEGPPDCNKQKIQLPSCSLTTACCGNLSSVLSTSQTLTELDLKNNTIRDSGIQLLCERLKHPSCKLQKLGTSQDLTELDIAGNKLGQSGVQLLCEGLKHPSCKLQKLILEKCDFTAACCGELSSTLSTSRTLTELDLRKNKLEDSGVKLLCEGLTQPACNLQKLVHFRAGSL